MDHLLRFCSSSMDVWKALIPQRFWDWFFGMNFENWLKENLKDARRIGSFLNQDWAGYFTVILWHIWKGRNDLIFQNVNFSP